MALNAAESSIACVAHNDKADVISWSSRRLGPCAPLVAEAMAMDLAIKMACQANWRYIILVSDSKYVMDAINSRNTDHPWSISTILDNCLLSL